MGQYIKHHIPSPSDEISLVDIIWFFLHNWRFLALTTAGVSAIALFLSLVQPKQYQKQLTLSIKSMSVPVSALPAIDIDQAGALSVKLLENAKLSQTTTQPKYDPTNKKIDLTLRSLNSAALNGADSQIMAQLKTGFAERFSKSIETGLTSIGIQLERNKQILTQIEQQIALFPPTDRARLEALETQRATYLAAITSLEFDKRYLEQAQKNPAQLTEQIIPVEIFNESEVQQTRSLKGVIVVAIIASFMVSVFAAIIRDQVLRLKTELSEQKPQSSPDA